MYAAAAESAIGKNRVLTPAAHSGYMSTRREEDKQLSTALEPRPSADPDAGRGYAKGRSPAR
jgi:hypothetical protein